MNYLRYCLLFVGFFISISVASDFGQPQAQPQPPILPNSWRAIGELEQGGFASNDSYMIFYDWNAQVIIFNTLDEIFIAKLYIITFT